MQITSAGSLTTRQTMPVTPLATDLPVKIMVHKGSALDKRTVEIAASAVSVAHPAAHLAWLSVLRDALRHEVFLLEAIAGGNSAGWLPLALVRSVFFGRFLVSLPYINTSGVIAPSDDIALRLIDRAVSLADQHDVRYLELRHEREITHPSFTQKNAAKVLMRLALPATTEALLADFKSKLRSQIRSGEKRGFEVLFGGTELLAEFYAVFSRNMRDLGTPVYSRRLFESILSRFGDSAELCIVRLDEKPVAVALLLHGQQVTEVPSASSLKAYNATNANMVMYWHLLKRAIERGQKTFDFGRSTMDGNTYRFKKQWGAEPQPSVWQYYVRRGTIGQMRPDNARYGLAIQVWRRLPLWLTRLVGPTIVRGIP